MIFFSVFNRYITLSCLILGGSFAEASDKYVSTTGSNSNSGTISSPYLTVSYAVAQLSAGDILHIRGGTYYESGGVTVSVSGTFGNPITIQSYTGETAIIDSGLQAFRQTGNSDWEIVNANIGEYRSVNTVSSTSTPHTYIVGIQGYENERVRLIPYANSGHFRATNQDYVDSTTPIYAGPGIYYDSADSRLHIRLATTTAMEAAEARYGTVFSSSLPHPKDYSIMVSQSAATLKVSGSYLTFKNLVLNHGRRTININTNNVHDIRFEGVTVWAGVSGLITDGSGVNNVVMTQSKIYGDNPNWIYWSDIKTAPKPAELVEGTSFDIRNGGYDFELSYNHIRGSGQDLISVNNNENDILIHHNRIENCADNAIEVEGTVNVGDIRIYENYISNCLSAVSQGQDSASFTGPLLFYRNVVSFLRNPPVNRAVNLNTWNGGAKFNYKNMFKTPTGSADASQNAHYYHNTLFMLNAVAGMNMIAKTPNDLRIANNLMIMINSEIMTSYPTGTGMVFNGNLYYKVNSLTTSPLTAGYGTVSALYTGTGFEANGIGATAMIGTDPKLNVGLHFVVNTSTAVWELTRQSEVRPITDFMLASGSPAINAGISISSHPTIGTLPDSRSSSDIGAIPYGTSVNDYSGFPWVVNATTSATFSPSADAKVLSASPTTNYGTAVRLSADLTATESYLKFIVSGISGSVKSAKLRLYIVDSTPDGATINTVANTTWSETGITWNTRPAVGAILEDKGNIPNDSWIEYDVTSAIAGNGTFSFALIPVSTNEMEAQSKEGANPPQLVIVSQ
jgi:hypothetical protein